MPDQPDAERIRAIYAKAAPKYDRGMKFEGRLLGAEAGRRWIGEHASGEVLEVGIGTGLNIPHYRPDVRLTAIDLSPEMLAVARRRADQGGIRADLRIGDAEHLEFPADTFDTVVFGLSLCTVPNDRRAVGEARRVLRPGGRVVLMEHVGSPNRMVNVLQRMLEPLMVRYSADHQLREPLDHLRAEGFEIEELHRSKLGIMEWSVARKSS
jgi:ubiquinone/menaquinone biosynthesis C-methylase UbiE